jgi:hypothetical protein
MGTKGKHRKMQGRRVTKRRPREGKKQIENNEGKNHRRAKNREDKQNVRRNWKKETLRFMYKERDQTKIN